MTCKDVNSLLDRLMDGELTEEERRELEAHGQSCPDCAAEIRATLEMKALFEETSPEADVPLAAQARWRGAIKQAAKADRQRRFTRWIGSAAAAVVVLVGVGLALNGSLAPKRDAAQLLAAPQVVQEEVAAEADAGEAAEERAVANKVSEAVAAGGAAEIEAAQPAEAVEMDAAAEVEAAGEVACEAAEAPAVIETDGARNAISSDSFPAMDAAFDAEAAEPEAKSYEEADMDEACEEADTARSEEDAFEDVDAFEDTETFKDVNMAAAPQCAALAQRSPACEYTIRSRNVEVACTLIEDLAGEFEGDADVQPLEDGGANVYVELDAGSAAGFFEAVSKVDDSANPAQPPQLTDEGRVLVLLVIEKAEE